MYYALIVVVIIGVVVYACLKKKRGNTEKPRGEEKPDDGGNHTEITVNVPTEIKGYIVKDGIKKEVTIRCMPQGLQVFDENGTCVVDVTSRITKYLGELIIPTTEGSYYDARLKDGDFWFLITDLINPNVFEQWDGSESKFFPKINAKDGLITWEYPVNMKYRPGVKIIYGIY